MWLYIYIERERANFFGKHLGFSGKHAQETASVFFRNLQRHFSDTFLAKFKNKGTAFFRNNRPYAFRRRVAMHGDFTPGIGSMAWLGLASAGVGLRGTGDRMHLNGI